MGRAFEPLRNHSPNAGFRNRKPAFDRFLRSHGSRLQARNAERTSVLGGSAPDGTIRPEDTPNGATQGIVRRTDGESHGFCEKVVNFVANRKDRTDLAKRTRQHPPRRESGEATADLRNGCRLESRTAVSVRNPPCGRSGVAGIRVRRNRAGKRKSAKLQSYYYLLRKTTE